MPINLSPRAKRMVKWVGYPLLALVTFYFGLQQAMPYGRLERKIPELLASKYDVTFQVSRGWRLGTVIFDKIALHSRPTKPDDKVSTIFIDQLTLHAGVYSLLSSFFQSVSLDYDAHLGGGDVHGTADLSASRVGVDVDIDKVSAEAVPGLGDIVGLPMGGRIQGTGTFDLPAGDWRQAEADIKLGCTSNCTIGDGIAKIYPKARPGQPQLDGVTVAKLFLTEWRAEVVMSKGKLDLKTLDLKSDDGELYVDFHAKIERVMSESTITAGCIKFKGSENLRKRDEKFYNALTLTGAPLGPDGYHYIKLMGTIGNMRRLPQLCDLNGGSGEGDAAGAEAAGHPRQPTIHVTPTPSRPVQGYVPPTPTGPANPPPPAPPPVIPSSPPPADVQQPSPPPGTPEGPPPSQIERSINRGEQQVQQPPADNGPAGTPTNPPGTGTDQNPQGSGSGTNNGADPVTGLMN